MRCYVTASPVCHRLRGSTARSRLGESPVGPRHVPCEVACVGVVSGNEFGASGNELGSVCVCVCVCVCTYACIYGSL